MRRIIIPIVVMTFLASGCAVNIYKKSPKDKVKIKELKVEVDKLHDLRKKEQMQFQAAKDELARQLRAEIRRREVGLELEERGLVITLADSILFDSGKANIKDAAHPVLDKVTEVIRTKTPDKNIGVEGHTDNVPIKYSGWKSNWELSTARATSVLHYLEDIGKVNPAKMSATGYGEHRPIASNDTPKGRAKNRRVEIVILPKYPKKSISELEKKQRWVK